MKVASGSGGGSGKLALPVALLVEDKEGGAGRVRGKIAIVVIP